MISTLQSDELLITNTETAEKTAGYFSECVQTRTLDEVGICIQPFCSRIFDLFTNQECLESRHRLSPTMSWED